jgi:hypothetical protein
MGGCLQCALTPALCVRALLLRLKDIVDVLVTSTAADPRVQPYVNGLASSRYTTHGGGCGGHSSRDKYLMFSWADCRHPKNLARHSGTRRPSKGYGGSGYFRSWNWRCQNREHWLCGGVGIVILTPNTVDQREKPNIDGLAGKG